MPRKRKEDRCVIAEMECLCMKLAASEMKIGLTTLSTLMRKSRQGKAKPALRFIQRGKGCDAWFPIPWIHEYINELGEL